MPVLMEIMEQHGHLDLLAEVCSGLLAMGAATMGRALGTIGARPVG
ncbi:hypothetical protein [Dankookia rubra]|nr:hypothetical protein [Dankookia rubra]